MGRWLRRIALALVVLAAALTVTVVVLARSLAFHDWLRRQVVARVNATLHGVGAIGAIEGDLLDRLVLRDVRLVAEGRRVLAVRRLSARYDLLPLLLGRGLTLRDVAVDGLALTLIEDGNGWNVARLVPPEPEPGRPSTLTIVLADAHVTGAAIKVVRPADVWRLRVAELTGAARFAPDAQSITLTGLVGDLPGRGVRIAALSGALTVDAAAARLDGVRLRTEGSEARADARIPLRPDGAYDVTLDVPRLAAGEVRRLARGDVPAADLVLNAHLRGPARWAALDAKVTSGAGSIALAGNVGEGERPSYEIEARLDALDLAGLLGPPRPATSLTGTIDLKGIGTSLADAAAGVTVELRDSKIAERALSRLRAHADLADQTVELAADAALEAGALEAKGRVGITDERYDLKASATELDLPALLGNPAAQARITGTVAVTGMGFRPDRAQGEVHVTLGPSALAGLEVTSGQADVRATAAALTIDRLRVDARGATLEASGTLGREADALPSSGSLRYAFHAADVAPLARLAGAGSLAGSLAVDGTAAGSLDALALRATVNGRQLTRGDVEVAGVSGTLTGDGLGGARGRVDVSARADGVHAAGRRFASVDATGTWRAPVAGKAAAHLEVRAQEDERHRHEVVADAVLAPAERRVTLGGLRLDLGDDTWRAEGTPVLVQRGQTVAIHELALRSSKDGRLRIEGQTGTAGAQSLTVELSGLDVGAFAPRSKDAPSGRLSGTLRLGGTAQVPTVEAHAEIASPIVTRVRYESAAADARIGGGRAQIAARVVQSGERALTLEASSPLRLTLAPFEYASDGSLAGALRAQDVDLAIVGPLLPQVADIRGTLQADLTLGGTLRAPEAHGPLALVGGRARVIPLGVTYDPVEVRMSVDGAAASIESLRIVSGNGSLTAKGSASAVGGDAVLDVQVQLDRFPLFANQFGEGATSGTIAVSGTSAAPIVEGALTTDRFVLHVPESLPGSVRPPDPTITLIGPGVPPPPPAAKPEESVRASAPNLGLYERAAITVQVDVPNNAWIRRSDTEIELRGWMTAWKKPAQALALAGEIDTVRGWYAFEGKTFTIENGRVTFTGQDFDPLLELAASRTSGDYTVRVKIGGALSKPTLTLESEPSLDQADILAVLLFGKPASQLNSGESSGLREQAIGVASSYVASGLRESVSDTLGLDTLQFETGNGAAQTSSLTLGKYVAPDVFVSLAHRFAKQGVEEIRVEYTVTPHWSVETSADTLGDSGLDVFWKNRY
ncbi:MAG TPA: translocation/assembly module TamB domain-containing protein [Candidatus Binatia bacterium]|jgi:autotransporter translocation and assembly factor TamB